MCGLLHVILERGFQAELARGRLVPDALHDVAESAKYAGQLAALQWVPHEEPARDVNAADESPWVSRCIAR